MAELIFSEAKNRLSDLCDRAEQGEDVVIVRRRPGRREVRFRLLADSFQERRLGVAAHLRSPVLDDLTSPLSEDEDAAWRTPIF